MEQPLISSISSPTLRFDVSSAAPPKTKNYRVGFSNGIYLPINIFLIIRGKLPDGDSKPPSIEKPSPAPSFTMLMIIISFPTEERVRNIYFFV